MSHIANLWLKLAETVKHRSSNLANKFREMADKAAANENTKLIVTIGDERIETEYVNINDLEDKSWDENTPYRNAALYFKNKANPISVQLDKAKENVYLKSSEIYKRDINDNTVTQMLSTQTGMSQTAKYHLLTAVLMGILVLLVFAQGI